MFIFGCRCTYCWTGTNLYSYQRKWWDWSRLHCPRLAQSRSRLAEKRTAFVVWSGEKKIPLFLPLLVLRGLLLFLRSSIHPTLFFQGIVSQRKNRHTLLLPGIKESTFGVYTCRATNKFGSDERTTEVSGEFSWLFAHRSFCDSSSVGSKPIYDVTKKAKRTTDTDNTTTFFTLFFRSRKSG